MRAAFALRINSGKIIFICESGKSADFPDSLFHGKGVTADCSGSACFLRMQRRCGKSLPAANVGFSAAHLPDCLFTGRGVTADCSSSARFLQMRRRCGKSLPTAKLVIPAAHLPDSFFTGRDCNGKLQRQRLLPADAAVLREIPACGKAGFSGCTFERLPLRDGAFGIALQFPISPEAPSPREFIPHNKNSPCIVRYRGSFVLQAVTYSCTYPDSSSGNHRW